MMAGQRFWDRTRNILYPPYDIQDIFSTDLLLATLVARPEKVRCYLFNVERANSRLEENREEDWKEA